MSLGLCACCSLGLEGFSSSFWLGGLRVKISSRTVEAFPVSPASSVLSRSLTPGYHPWTQYSSLLLGLSMYLSFTSKVVVLIKDSRLLCKM